MSLEKKREYVVAKSNHIVQKCRYELSVTEQRAIAYLCSMIQPDHKSTNLIYEFNILEYARVCDISADNGRIYEETKALLKGLIGKITWITLEDGTETTINWVNKVWTNKRSGKARVRLDEDMAPYLFDLKEKFTSYGLYNILKLKSQYSIRLFELLKSYSYQKQVTFSVEELKRLLMVDDKPTYRNFNNFRVKILDRSLGELNTLTDLNVLMELHTKGKKVEKITFRIKEKSSTESYLVYRKKMNS